MFFKIGVLKKKNSGQEHPQEVFCKKRYFQKISQILQESTYDGVLSCEICKNFKNIFLHRTPLVAVPDHYSLFIAPENIKKPVVF